MEFFWQYLFGLACLVGIGIVLDRLKDLIVKETAERVSRDLEPFVARIERGLAVIDARLTEIARTGHGDGDE